MENAEVTETVYFNASVTIVYGEEEGCWVALGRQMGVVNVGDTLEEAEERSREAHILLVRGYKKLGYQALTDFMAECGIDDYRIGEEPETEGPEEAPSLNRGGNRELDGAA